MRANQAGSVGLTIRVRTNILSSHQVRLAGNVNVARTAPSETRGQNPKKRQFRGEISPRTRICGALGRPLYLSASETKISYKSLRVTRNMTMKRFRKTKNLRVKLPLFGQLQAHREVFASLGNFWLLILASITILLPHLSFTAIREYGWSRPKPNDPVVDDC